MLKITNLSVSIAEQEILTEVSLELHAGKVYGLIGQNGSGKSSLALTIMGHPDYVITGGAMTWDNQNLADLSPEKRAKLGIFLAFQSPLEIPGVGILTFLKEAYGAKTGKQISIADFRTLIEPYIEILGLPEVILERSLHQGFSGGERKKLELLQLLVLQPQLAILDEIDSGLDIDAIKVIHRALEFAQQENPSMSIVFITHYQQFLTEVKPEKVFIFYQGTCVMEGDAALIKQVEMHGYEPFKNVL